ncbi:MAG TPA: serine hydrolase [Actinomycetota bacterium]|nr:serine hydrolase [Actinomycetota bacterium]
MSRRRRVKSGSRWRRWVRGIGFGLASVVVAFLAVYGWAWASLDSSAVARAMIWMDADVGDQFRFPSRTIPAGEAVSPLPVGDEVDLGPSPLGGAGGFDGFLRQTDTRAFLVVQDDRVVYERYLDGSTRRTLHTTWSVAKSVLSTLVGIAVEDGLIGSIDDPVTEYLPELLEKDRRFERITLRHLLTMSSGLRYWDTDLPWPFADDSYTYYGADLREIALEKSEVEGPPGEAFHYNNYNPLLLGLVLERVSGMSVAEYTSTRLWQPLGAERDATWSLDSEDSGFEKMESGVNATAADYARFGLAFLHGGEWGGSRIVSADWVHDATTADIAGDPADRYQYFWWVDLDRPGRYYALGNFGQYIYVAPDAGTVIVRTASDWGVDNHAWLGVLRDVADREGAMPVAAVP